MIRKETYGVMVYPSKQLCISKYSMKRLIFLQCKYLQVVLENTFGSKNDTEILLFYEWKINLHVLLETEKP